MSDLVHVSRASRITVVAVVALASAGCSNAPTDVSHGDNYDAAGDAAAPSDGSSGGDSLAGDDTTSVPDTSEDTATGTDTQDSGAMVDTGTSTDTGTLGDTGAAPLDSSTPVDTGSTDAGMPPADTGGGADGSDAGCSSTMAVLGGNASSLYAATWRGGTWTATQTLAGGLLASVPALASNGTEYLGVIQESGTNYLDYTLSGAVWSTLAGVPPTAPGATTTESAPALAVIGGAVHLVYWGTDDKFYHGAYTAGSWTTPANDPVGGTGPNQSYGPSAPTAAGQLAGFTIVQAGADSLARVQSWDATWAASAPIAGATSVANTISPRIVALRGAGSGGTATLMVVYASSATNGGNVHVLYYSVLTGSMWSAPAVVYDTTVYSANPVSVAPLANGGAVLVYEGGNNEPYYVVYTPAGAPSWSAPAPLVTGTNPVVASVPQIAAGVCGAGAVAVFASTGNTLQVTTWNGANWSTPTALAGTAGATYATIATQP